MAFSGRRRRGPHHPSRRQMTALNVAAYESNLDLALDVRPLFTRPQHREQLIEGGRVLGRKLEPGQEIEVLAQLARLIQAACDAGQVLHTVRNVARALFEDGAPLVLR